MEIVSTSIQAMYVSVFVLFIILILCIVWLYIRRKDAAKIFLIGMLGYFIPQICLRYPLVSWLQTSTFPLMNVYVVILLLSSTSAWLETIGRYFVVKHLLKQDESRSAGIAAGFGHGLCEAIFLLLITYIYNLFVIYLAQLGGSSTQIELAMTALNNVPLYIFYFTLFERCLFILIQAGLSSLMMNGLRKQRKYIFIFVFVVHFIIDASITIASNSGINIYFIDTIIAVVALIAIVYMWKSERWFPKKEERVPEVILEGSNEEEKKPEATNEVE